MLAAADRDDNFQSVAVGQQALVELPARYYFTVAFQSDTLAAQLHLFEQRDNIDWDVKMVHRPID